MRPAACRAPRLATALLLAASPWLAAPASRAYTTAAASDPTWPGGSFTYHVNAASFGADGLGTSEVTAGIAEWEVDPESAIEVTRGTNTSRTPADDGFNDVYYEDSVFPPGSSVLAVTQFLFFPSTGEMAEADVTFNGVNFSWDDPVGPGCAGVYDVRATMTHEAGHALGLGHSSENPATCDPGSPLFDPVFCDATMYFAGEPCDRSGISLECDDLAGMRFLYPVGGVPRANWIAEDVAATPAPGPVAAGQTVTLEGVAANRGALSTSQGRMALFLEDEPGVATPANLVDSTFIPVTDSCRTLPIALSYQFTPGDTGLKYLTVVVDDTDTTAETDETDNLTSFGPFTLPDAAVLGASPGTLAFQAPLGGPAPSGQVVTVTNEGVGSFTWTAAPTLGWISVSPSSGSPGQSFTVEVDHAPLPAGEYDGAVTVTAPEAAGSPLEIGVHLTVVDEPVLGVSPASLSFAAAAGADLPPAQQLQVSNEGTGTLSWSVSDDAAWLTVSPPSGTDDGVVTVSVTTTSLPLGTHEATVTVDAGGVLGAPRLVPVSLQVTEPQEPILVLVPLELAFSGPVGGPAPDSQGVAVSNAGGGVLSFTVTSDRTWLSAAPPAGQAPAMLDVSVDPSGLPAGTHAGRLTVTSAGASGSPAFVDVSYDVLAGPSIDVVPSALSFAAVQGGSNPAPRDLTVRNDGAELLDYSLADDVSWLSCSPTNGSLPAGFTRVHRCTATVADLPLGMQVGTVTVTAPGADDSPRAVPVTLEITTLPPLVVTPEAMVFTATAEAPAPPAQSLSVSTSGEADATWSVTSSRSWAVASPSVGAGDASVIVTVDSAGLAVGQHEAMLTVSAPSLAASPRQVLVRLTVEDGPRLNVSPTAASWSVERLAPLPPARSITVSNSGIGTFSWVVTGAPTWLFVTPPSSPGPASFTVRPSTTDLPAGKHSATLRVLAAGAYGSPRDVRVTYTIEGPAMTFDPERVTLTWRDGVPVGGATASVSVGGAAPGALGWTAQTTRPWLTVSPVSGTTGDSITIGVAPGFEPPVGVHDAAVVFESSGAANTPAPVPVALVSRPAEAPSLHVSRASFDVAAGAVPASLGHLSLDEAGEQDTSWLLARWPSWLEPTPDAGAHGASVDLVVDPAGLAPGTRSDVLTVVWGDESVDLPLELSVHGAPELRLDLGEIELVAGEGAVSDQVPLKVSNVGAAPSTFTVFSPAPWIELSRLAGEAPSTVGVSARADALQPGEYTADVFVKADVGESLQSAAVRFVVPAEGVPVADFGLDVPSGCAPLTVHFEDFTSGAVDELAWDFGDGSTSTESTPTHVFEQPGRHVVRLTATAPAGQTTRSRTVVVRQPPLVSAGRDRQVAFEPDGETRLSLATARVAAAAPARISFLQWTTSRGVFEDTGRATSHLERPNLVVNTNRGGIIVTVTLTATDDAGCSAADAAEISFLPEFDADSDTVVELFDNCPGLDNFTQADFDGDGQGDRCDNCPLVFNPAQADFNFNGFGDDCDPVLDRRLALTGLHARPCDGLGYLLATSGGVGAQRRLSFVLSGPREPASAMPLGPAAAAGGTAVVAADGDPTRVELRVPAGFHSDAQVLRLGVPVEAGDASLDFTALDVTVGLAVLEAAIPGDEATVLLAPDADLAPSGHPDGIINVADVVLMLRAAIGIDVLDPDTAARADVAPGEQVGNRWFASPDCRIDVADIVVSVRLAAGTLTL